MGAFAGGPARGRVRAEDATSRALVPMISLARSTRPETRAPLKTETKPPDADRRAGVLAASLSPQHVTSHARD
jgi:hypothetical protein